MATALVPECPWPGLGQAAGPPGAAGRRLTAVAEHGHHRREPAAAQPLPVLPRRGRAGVQQAHTGFGVRGDHRPGPDDAILGTSEHCIAVHTSDWCVALAALDAQVHIQGARGRHVVPLTAFYLLPGDLPDRERRARPRRADHRGGRAAAAARYPVGLPEGPRPGLLRVRAHLGGRGSRHRRRADHHGAPGPGRRRDDPVEGPRGRGRPTAPRRASRRSAPPRRPRCGTRSPSTAPRSKSNWPKRTIVRVLQDLAGAQP